MANIDPGDIWSVEEGKKEIERYKALQASLTAFGARTGASEVGKALRAYAALFNKAKTRLARREKVAARCKERCSRAAKPGANPSGNVARWINASQSTWEACMQRKTGNWHFKATGADKANCTTEAVLECTRHCMNDS